MAYALPCFARRVVASLCVLLPVSLGLVCVANGQDDLPGGSSSRVVYNPDTVLQLQGNAPFAYSHAVSITAPSALPANAATTVNLRGEALAFPPALAQAAAVGLLTFSPAALTFTGPGETKVVTITLAMPIGTPDGQFSYHISCTGWPVGYGIADDGTSINMVLTPPYSFPAVAVRIDAPVDGAEFDYVMGQPALRVPVSVAGSCSNSNPVDAVSVAVSAVDQLGVAITLPPINWSYSGAGSAQEVASTTLLLDQPGTYTIAASARSYLGGTANTTASFTVNRVVPAPSVVITQPPRPMYDYYLGSAALQIPFTFRGTSLLGGIRSLSATLNGAPVPISPVAIGTLVASASGTLNVATGGDYVLEVLATDDHGTARTTAEFHVNVLSVPAEQPVRGQVFFDVNADGNRAGGEFGLPGFTVTLRDSAGRTKATTTAPDGAYTFNVAPGAYTIAVQPVPGFRFTTPSRWTVAAATAGVSLPDCGLALCFSDLGTMTADGCTIGYWKNNIDKALAGRTNGTQVSAATLKSYTSALATLALEPFDGLTMKQASSIISSCSSAPKDLLAKQLVAAEYNFAAGAFIGNNGTLTYAFVYFAEFVLKNQTDYPSSYVLFVKDWCDAYNNSHGGCLEGPAPLNDERGGNHGCGGGRRDADHDDGDHRCGDNGHDGSGHRACGHHG